MPKDSFTLTFDPTPSGGYPHGYWYAFAEPGYDASGQTPIDALAGLVVEMSRALTTPTGGDDE
jgi:hypothetical protein